jgi:hypothetical protein
LLAPIALFVYNRPHHTRQCLESLQANPLASESTLYIFSDAWRADATDAQMEQVKLVRQLIREQQWAKEVNIIEHPHNQGFANNIINGIKAVLQEFDKIIVLEDDLVLSPYFLNYMNQALDLYQNTPQVMHISAYMYPIQSNLPSTFFFNIPSVWGWATWKHAWHYYQINSQVVYNQLVEQKKIKKFDLDNSGFFRQILEKNIQGTIHTWDIQWNATITLQDGFCLNPAQSLVQNIGLDGSGENTQANPTWQIPKLADFIEVKPIELVENQLVRKKVKFLLQYNGLSWQAYWAYQVNRLKGFLYKFSPNFLKKFYRQLKNLIFASSNLQKRN